VHYFYGFPSRTIQSGEIELGRYHDSDRMDRRNETKVDDRSFLCPANRRAMIDYRRSDLRASSFDSCL